MWDVQLSSLTFASRWTHTIVARYLKKFKVAPTFTSLDEFGHWLLPRDGVINTFVVEDPETKELTDMISFYTLPSTVVSVYTFCLNVRPVLRSCVASVNASLKVQRVCETLSILSTDTDTCVCLSFFAGESSGTQAAQGGLLVLQRVDKDRRYSAHAGCPYAGKGGEMQLPVGITRLYRHKSLDLYQDIHQHTDSFTALSLSLSLSLPSPHTHTHTHTHACMHIRKYNVVKTNC